MGASPLRREKSVDICALNDSKFIIQANRGRFVEIRSLNADLSEQVIRSLHKLCWNGDHYMARTYVDGSVSTKPDDPPPLEKRFYIIRDKSCIEVGGLASGFGCKTYTHFILSVEMVLSILLTGQGLSSYAVNPTLSSIHGA